MSCPFFVKNADISVVLRDDLSFTFDDDLPEILSIDCQRRRGLVVELILFIQNVRLFLSAVQCCVFNAAVHAVRSAVLSVFLYWRSSLRADCLVIRHSASYHGSDRRLRQMTVLNGAYSSKISLMIFLQQFSISSALVYSNI